VCSWMFAVIAGGMQTHKEVCSVLGRYALAGVQLVFSMGRCVCYWRGCAVLGQRAQCWFEEFDCNARDGMQRKARAFLVTIIIIMVCSCSVVLLQCCPVCLWDNTRAAFCAVLSPCHFSLHGLHGLARTATAAVAAAAAASANEELHPSSYYHI
jgi:hypothetical protein